MQALEALNAVHFPLKNISLVGNAELVNDHLQVKTNYLKEIGASIGVVTGTVLGLLTGIGVFVVPGFGFLYGAGAIVGAAAGLDFGIMGGGFLAILAIYGVKKEQSIAYDEHLKEGKWMLIAQGDESQVKKVMNILHANSQYIGLSVH
jgi:hypothetical protein